jgi:hypothetical protein
VHATGALYSSGDVTGNIVKAADTSVVEISGGTYTQDVNDWCVEGYEAVDNQNGTWTVLPHVAMVGDEKFTSLAEAIAAAADAGENLVTLLGDSKESVTLPDGIRIYANGFTVGAVVDAKGHIVEKVDGAYDARVHPPQVPIRSLVLKGDEVELRFVLRSEKTVTVMVSTDLEAWTQADVTQYVYGGIGQETVVTVVKPSDTCGFFKLVME